MSILWYEDYFGKGTRPTRAFLDPKGRLFIADVTGGIDITEEHNCDAMGCGSVGPHIHSVYINAEKYEHLKAAVKFISGWLESGTAKGRPMDLMTKKEWDKWQSLKGETK